MEEQLNVEENPWWSPSRLAVMERCKKEYWFKYVRHLDSKISTEAAVGKHNHRIAERTWLESDKGLVPGYKSYDSCIGASVGNWKYLYALPGKVEGREINWKDYEGQGFARWLLGRIAETAGIIYNRFLSEEPRLKAEVKMQAELEGLKIMVIADELRKNLVIRDHKSGNEKIGEYFLKNNIQMTLCSMCLFECLQKPYTIASDIYPEFAGISLDEFLERATLEINDICPRTHEGIHKSNSVIYPAKRTERDFQDAIRIIQAGNKSLRERDFHASRKDCDFCDYRAACNDYHPEDYHVNEQEKLFPLFYSAGIVLDSCHPQRKAKRLQKNFRFAKTK